MEPTTRAGSRLWLGTTGFAAACFVALIARPAHGRAANDPGFLVRAEPAPEPATWAGALLMLSALAMVARRARRRNTARFTA